MTPAEENKRQTRFAIVLALVLVITVLGVFAWQSDRYEHPMPASECLPNEYPICQRSVQPTPTPEPLLGDSYGGIMFTAILALILIIGAFKSAVLKQEHIAAPRSAAQQASAPMATSAPAPSAPLPELPVRARVQSVRTRTPPAIPENEITAEMIAPPKAKPSGGVDTKGLGGKR